MLILIVLENIRYKLHYGNIDRLSLFKGTVSQQGRSLQEGSNSKFWLFFKKTFICLTKYRSNLVMFNNNNVSTSGRLNFVQHTTLISASF